RVPYIKIAERICLTRMLSTMNDRKIIPVDAGAYARINLAVYAPLAEQLSTWQFKTTLEDASLALLDPSAYRAIESAINVQESRDAENLTRVIAAIQECLHQSGISCASVYGRRKHIFSTYRKMKSKGLSPDDMIDLLGVRIIIHPDPSPDETA